MVDLEGKPLLDKDEHPRAGATMEALAKLEPAFVGMGAAPMGPNGETVDQLALKRYPQVKADPPRPHTPATPAASSTARPPWRSPPPTT